MSEYERLKAEWIEAHPGSTPAEYTQAMREIARKCGV